MKSKSHKIAPAVLAARMVASQSEQSDAEILAGLGEHPDWEALVGRNYTPLLVKIADQLRAALPKEKHAVLLKYADLHVEYANADAEAAFTLGRAWERRFGGAR
jgi:hypothetical protein